MGRVLPTLAKQNTPLASAAEQRATLATVPLARTFEASLAQSSLYPLRATGIDILQINVGKKCNQTCRHCHVDAGPDRKEIMTRATMGQCRTALEKSDCEIVDITGGAPEMNPNFRWLVERVRGLGRHVIDRCNLTILTLPAYRDMIDFLAGHRVEIVASLPCYTAEQTDAQRGEGVFERSIEAIGKLNAAGYGQPDSGLELNLVYNPVGAFLPPKQAAIEADYKRELKRRYGLVFNKLYTITNLPINRFLEYLIDSGNYDDYMRLLIEAYNPTAAAGVMCREMLSIGWDGQLEFVTDNYDPAIAVIAVGSKLIGSGLGALLAGEGMTSSIQIGTGMISRGEVGLIVATVGLTTGLIDQDLFSVMVLMVLITKLITPILLRIVFPAPGKAEQEELHV